MNPELSVKISADIDLLRDNFRKAIGNINKFDKDTKAALNSVDKGFERLANEVDKDMKKVSASVVSSSNTVSKSLASAAAASAKSGTAITNGSNKAAMALTDVGRVAQDLPYGFMGIQNNLNPMIESFGRLKAETGSTGGALKAMLNSLYGPAGLGIALSVVSAGILLYQQYQQKANKATENAKKVTDEYVSSLSQLDQVQLKGEQNAQKEVVSLRTLYKAATDTTISLEQRKKAVDGLQKEYPKYFGNLKDETILNGQARGAYDKLTTSIIATAKARAAQDLITKNSSRQLENEKKIRDLEAERLKIQTKRGIEASKGVGEVSTSTRDAAGISSAVKLNSLTKDLNENLKSINNLKTDSNKLTAENLRLEAAINAEIKKGAELVDPSAEPTVKGGKSIKTALIRNLETTLSEPIKLSKPVSVATDIKVNIIDVDFGLTEWQKKLEVFAENSSQILTTGVADAFAGLASGIGESLANGSSFIESVGSNLLDVVGTIAINLGKAAIGIGIAMDAIKNAFKAGPAAVAAGVALIAVGTFIKSQVPKITQGQSSQTEQPRQIRGFASGVNNFSGGLALVGEKGPELVTLPSGTSVLNNNRTNQILSANNGINKVEVFGEASFAMDKFVIKFKSVEKRLQRQGLII